MIGKVLRRGTDVRRLLYYLFTEGLAGEKGLESDHDDPRLVGSWDGFPGELEPLRGVDGRRDFRALVARLQEPVALLGLSADEHRRVKPVWHMAIAAAKDPKTGAMLDRKLSDAEWADIAAEHLHRIGLAPRDDPHGVRWVAVRHADDHVHVVATLARQDGRRPRTSYEKYRSMEASRYVEQKYGLTAVASRGRTGSPTPTRGEQRRHRADVARRASQGRSSPRATDRELLRQYVRAAAAGADSAPVFFARLAEQGLLVRQRFSERNPGQITGYAVALPDGDGRSPIWFGGGKLASDLTLPKLQARWQPDRVQADGPTVGRSRAVPEPASASARSGLSEQDRRHMWEQAHLAAARATAHICGCVDAYPARAADAAWAASDFFASAAQLVEGRRGGPLSEAAAAYDEAARDLHRRTPAASSAGNGLRTAGRMMSAARFVRRSEVRQMLVLIAQMAALADAVARLREAQDRAAQAAAARQAAERLSVAASTPASGLFASSSRAAATAAQRVVTRPSERTNDTRAAGQADRKAARTGSALVSPS